MKKSAQSMAIWNDKAFLFNNTGICRVLNLKSGKTEKVFDLLENRLFWSKAADLIKKYD